MTTLHFIFRVTLWYNDANGDFVKEVDYMSAPQNDKDAADQFTYEPEFDAHFVSSLMGNFDRIISSKFDEKTGKLHVWTKVDQVTPESLAYELYGMSPEGLGPDGWMSGDMVLPGSEGENYDSSIEFIPRVEKVYTEVEVDLSKLPVQK